ncbi:MULTISPECIES: LysR family transcriptional regulator [Rhizobium/Agrobacterium group]|jgi:DNA-binding transcriptional LysR family regulator|uniref:HTH-type transcriptional regulator TtuA n=3 Tax=Rhizobium/Agrobacterium group TaxID=227290 RepID=A0A1B9TNZ6_AGRTU|nr:MULTISPECIES: LysR family transcriptional regulator [Rhizobium/Agrobacterium group]KAA3508057.1 LysR family transcriptional regulator [Agrobacterium tumefaciens]MDX8323655.1 LysR family transcriptional regulator [Agrobacterium tumefaciens]NSL23289.1 LysR family transcriptional regulator [Agrobacterium tumefaciens]NTB88796.1 LysR family transcriptional regulator [Agrobacterium tumefaciens]NTC19051.1 LysR family transcriptional regulator [Agrobacterium tumefaciens]
MNRVQLSQLAVLAAVAEGRSFRKAAAELAIAPSAVSHAVSSLEASLGLRLLHRTTRSVSPTEEGRRLLETLGPALAEIDAVIDTLAEHGGRPAGPLRITLPRLAAEDLIMPRLGEFLRLYPDISLEISTDDRFEDIVAKGFDAGLRLGENLEADMIAVKASGPWRGAIVGAPTYFEENPPPREPRDLMRHRCILRRFSSGLLYRWELEKDGRPLVVDVQGPLILSDQSLIRRAAIDGAGLAFVFEQRVEDDIKEGRLVRVLEDWCAPFDGFYIYYPSRRQMRPALRAFVDFFRFRG